MRGTGRVMALGVSLAVSGGMTRADPPAGDADYGEYLSQDCLACHHAGGDEAGIPPLAGLSADELATALRAYRTGQASNPVMQMIAGSLGEAEIAALAAYYSGLSR